MLAINLKLSLITGIPWSYK